MYTEFMITVVAICSKGIFNLGSRTDAIGLALP